MQLHAHFKIVEFIAYIPVGSGFNRSAGNAPTAGEYVLKRAAPLGRLAVDPM